MPDTIAEQLAHQQGGVIPAPVPGPEHPADERAATRARSARPATRLSGCGQQGDHGGGSEGHVVAVKASLMRRLAGGYDQRGGYCRDADGAAELP